MFNRWRAPVTTEIAAVGATEIAAAGAIESSEQALVATDQSGTESTTVRAESAAVRAAVAQGIDVTNSQYDQLHAMLDAMRAGSVAAPHMATWMKELVYALPPSGTAVERSLGTLAVEDAICPTTGRVLRPWLLQLLIMQMVCAEPGPLPPAALPPICNPLYTLDSETLPSGLTYGCDPEYVIAGRFERQRGSPPLHLPCI